MGTLPVMSAVVVIAIVVAVLVVVALVIAVRHQGERTKDKKRVEAAEHRDLAGVAQLEAERKAAEADERAARARQEQLAAQQQTLEAQSAADEAADMRRRADEIDPDVSSDAGREA